jgi:hypothetical protein
VIDEMEIAVDAAPTGATKPLRFRLRTANDIDPSSNVATTSPRVVRAAHARARAPRDGGRRYAGTASDARGGGVARSLLKVRHVEVAILRRGGTGCRWVGSYRGGFRTRKAGRGHACDRPVWLAARGTHAWRLTLGRRLPRGRYTLLARALQSEGLAENRFTRAGRNRIGFRIR